MTGMRINAPAVHVQTLSSRKKIEKNRWKFDEFLTKTILHSLFETRCSMYVVLARALSAISAVVSFPSIHRLM